MGRIKLLDNELVNKIAAGEVVQRPASIIKELLENSIDASSTKIDIEIENAGIDLIKISDNGTGMNEEDIKLSFVRHATSKISTVNDLFSIDSLGFRGEAVASIAAVSKLTIISKTNDSDFGIKIKVTGEDIISEEKIGANTGTTFIVKELFYNTPARKKYLKSKTTEYSHIIDIVTRYSLTYPEMGISLKHDGRVVFNSPATENKLNNITAIYGKEVAKDLLAVDYYSGGIEVTGFISKPKLTKVSKEYQSIYINGRYVKNKLISDAVYQGYGNLLFGERHPVFVLEIKMNTKDIDVNVHPSKIHIKLSHEDLIFFAVKTAISDTLNSNNLVPEIRSEEIQNKLNYDKQTVVKKESEMRNYAYEKSSQGELLINNSHDESKKVWDESGDIIQEESLAEKYIQEKQIKKETEHTDDTETKKESNNYSTIKFDLENDKIKNKFSFKVHGQFDKTYIIAESVEGLMLIDQHAAEERVNFEKFYKAFNSKKIEVQELINPIMVELSPKESNVVSTNIEGFSNFGFVIEDFGDNTFIIRSTPAIFNEQISKETFLDLIHETEISKTPLTEISYDKIASKSCRSSIKAGAEMSISQMIALIDKLLKCKNPYTCPHGRPTMIKFTTKELEKLFKRVV